MNDPRQLSLFDGADSITGVGGVPEISGSEISSIEIFENWLKFGAPLIHIWGQNPHLKSAETFRSYDRRVWVNTKKMDILLDKYGYIFTHTLTSGGQCYRVYRPLKRSLNGPVNF